MQQQQTEWVWLDERQTVSVTELSRAAALSEAELDELVGYGALAPLAPALLEPRFSADCVMPLREAGKLRADYDLDLFTVGLLLGYLTRIDALERQLKSLHATASRPGEP